MWCSGEVFPKWGVLLFFLLILHICLSPTTCINSPKPLCRDFVVKACRDSADSSILQLSPWNLKKKPPTPLYFPDTFMIEKLNEFRLKVIVVLCKKRCFVNIFIFFYFQCYLFIEFIGATGFRGTIIQYIICTLHWVFTTQKRCFNANI